jgi:DNA-binding NtrC family response regulator
LLGETGVGKELFARRLHEASPRREGPFVTIACAALNPALVESELFGHERGSFTGAEAAKVGLFEAARGGTVLLDEVAELPLAVQAKLLRVLEERRIQRLGASETHSLDVRFVATAHPDLEGDVERGTFRRDLLFRLNGVTIHVPPLRQRKEEIALLAQHFALSVPGRPKTLSQAALAVLLAHDWPGNVRELRNVIERAVVLSSDHVLGPEQLELGFRTAALAPTSERERIIDALRQAAGNQTRAAEILGISRRTLVTRLKDYDIPRPRGGRSE